ncbi:hypothetical protein [Kineosporia sp. NBRC 101731]|uniref:hypothetical protein n=1 Tax=Kineosporia sp. NBRC 101731 TaxID=3032199 RepID=UPI0024A1B9BF|nr:hypothetical protein [Kineosporia sp. NBRC 101731]GLY31340.1 hypothetical protein Kisp02_47050 [Kineosporia sp. NBRC 101731]
MTTFPEQVRALERGDWRAVIGGPIDTTAGRRTATHLARWARLVADSMRLQTLGRVTQAHHQLEEAASSLAAATGRTGRRSPGAQPHPSRVAEHLLWRAGLVLAREQNELNALRRFSGRIAKGRPELVCAGVEYLTWVEFDPFSVRPGRDDARLLGLDDPAAAERFGTGNRIDLCTRATGLREFAGVWDGPVSGRTWQRMGGYRGIRAEALLLLAAREESRSPDPMQAAPRLGRLRAWEYARQWSADSVPGAVA